MPLMVGEQAEGHGGWIRLHRMRNGQSAPQATRNADLQIKKGTKRNRSVCFVFPSGKRRRREHSHGPNTIFTIFCWCFIHVAKLSSTKSLQPPQTQDFLTFR